MPIAIDPPLPLRGDAELRERPILAIAASCWDERRVQAFRTIYAAMRRVDDLVDDRRKLGGPIEEPERAQIQQQIRCGCGGAEPDGAEARQLWRVRCQFALPSWPWQRWEAAMCYDLSHDGFGSWRDFVRYSLGAAAAPGAIFLHLAAATELAGGCGGYAPPRFDIDRASRPLALFAYVVHILRDFRRDLRDGLSSFPRALVAACGLERRDLRRIADGNGPVPDGFTRLARAYCSIAERYRARARRAIDRIAPQLQPRARLSVEIVLDLYTQLLERAQISPPGTVPDMSVSVGEVRERLNRLVRCAWA